MTGKTRLTTSCSAGQLTFPWISVRFHFRAPSNQSLLDSWEEKRVTGFKLSWFLDGKDLATTTTDATTTDKMSTAESKAETRFDTILKST